MAHIDFDIENEEFIERDSIEKVPGNHATSYGEAKYDKVSYADDAAIVDVSNEEFLFMWNRILNGFDPTDRAIVDLSFADDGSELMDKYQIAYALDLDPNFVTQRKRAIFKELREIPFLQERARAVLQDSQITKGRR